MYGLNFLGQRLSQAGNQQERSSKESLEMKPMCYSEKSVKFYQTAGRYIPEIALFRISLYVSQFVSKYSHQNQNYLTESGSPQ
jgi:hypothetical protein